MVSTAKPRDYVAVSTELKDGRPYPAGRKRTHNYKPTALKTPTLLLFATLLAVCVGLIEVILHQSSRPEDLEMNNGSKADRRREVILERRTANTSIASSTAQTPKSLPPLLSSISSLDHEGASLCSTMSSLSAQTPLAPTQIAIFSQWLSSWSAMDKAYTSVRKNLADAIAVCSDGSQATTLGCDVASTVISTLHIGCLTTAMETGCSAGGAFQITNSTVTGSVSVWCAASVQALLSVTSATSSSRLLLVTSPSPTATRVSDTSVLPTITIATPVETIRTSAASAPNLLSVTIPSRISTRTSEGSILPTTVIATPDKSLSVSSVSTSNLLVLTPPSNTPTKTSVTVITASASTSNLLYLTTPVSPWPATSKTSIIPTITIVPTSYSAITTLTTIVTDTTHLLVLTDLPHTADFTVVVTQTLLSPTQKGTTTTQISSSQSTPRSLLSVAFTVNQKSLLSQTSQVTYATTSPTQTVSSSSPSISELYSTGGSFLLVTSQYTGHPVSVLGDTTVGTTLLTTEPPHIQTLYTVNTTFTTIIGTVEEGHSTSISVVVILPTVLTTSPVPATTVATTTLGNGNATTTVSQIALETIPANALMVNRSFTNFSFFAALYLAPILAVIIKAFWEIIYSSFKMMEPFERLNRPKGSSASRTLFAQYLSNSISLDAVKATFAGRLLPMFTLLIYSLVTILATVAASSMTIQAMSICPTEDGYGVRCNPAWLVNSTVLRCVECLLVTSIILTLFVVTLSFSSRSGVSANPSTIASVASLLNHEALIRSLRGVDMLANDEQFANALRECRLRLEYHETSSGLCLYGVTRSLSPAPTESAMEGEPGRLPNGNWFSEYSAVSNPTMQSINQTRPFWPSLQTQSTLLDITQMLTTAGLFAIVTAYFYDNQPDALNNFFNSNGFWPRFIMVSIASLVDIQWKRLEREVRITEPYRRMSKGFARPETTVLLELNGTCWSQLFRSVYRLLRYRDMWFQTLVTLVTALSDLNIIAVAGVVYSEAQTLITLRVSGYFAITVTGLMLVVLLVAMSWWRRESVVRSMPRCPENLGTIFSYLCASRLTQILSQAQLEDLSGREIDEIVVATGWRFWFGVKMGADGLERWCIDIEGEDPVNEPNRNGLYEIAGDTGNLDQIPTAYVNRV